jgi:hypothetical protein
MENAQCVDVPWLILGGLSVIRRMAETAGGRLHSGGVPISPSRSLKSGWRRFAGVDTDERPSDRYHFQGRASFGKRVHTIPVASTNPAIARRELPQYQAGDVIVLPSQSDEHVQR